MRANRTNREEKIASNIRFFFQLLFSKQRWEIEKSILLSKVRWIIPCIIVQFIHSIATNVAYYRHVQMYRLKDWGFDTVPALPNEMRWLSEAVFWTIFISILTIGFVPFMYKKPKYYMSTIWLRVLFVLFICIFLRSFSFLATSLPGPAPHCQPHSKSYKPPETIYDIIFRIDITNGCGDLVYSSHTMIAMTFVLAAHHYLRYFMNNHYRKYLCLMYCFYWPLMCLLAILIISARKHYSVDVIVALYVTPLVFHASFSLMKDIDGPEYLSQLNALPVGATIESETTNNKSMTSLTSLTSLTGMAPSKQSTQTATTININDIINEIENNNNNKSTNGQNIAQNKALMKQRQSGPSSVNSNGIVTINMTDSANVSGRRTMMNDFDSEKQPLL